MNRNELILKINKLSYNDFITSSNIDTLKNILEDNKSVDGIAAIIDSVVEELIISSASYSNSFSIINKLELLLNKIKPEPKPKVVLKLDKASNIYEEAQEIPSITTLPKHFETKGLLHTVPDARAI